uniref:Phlebovirus_G2 domain-containing protein n=1 Tax=Panagrellus redivivus TaxID=6233 RepID=A0A7E4ZY32_PANRE
MFTCPNIFVRELLITNKDNWFYYLNFNVPRATTHILVFFTWCIGRDPYNTVRRDPTAGSCVGDTCSSIRPTDLLPELRTANDFAGITACTNGPEWLFNGCGLPTPSCYFSRTYALVKDCEERSSVVSLVMSLGGSLHAQQLQLSKSTAKNIDGMQQSPPRSPPWPDGCGGASHGAVRKTRGTSNIGACSGRP